MMVILMMMIMINGNDDDDNDGDDDDDNDDGWRPPRGGERAQRDTAPKLIVIEFAEIQNWGRCQ